MEMTGVVELIEKVNTKGNKYFSVRVAGHYCGNAYESVVKDFKTGDNVKATYEEKGNFKNVTNLEKTNNVATVVDFDTVRAIPNPKGYEPHPSVVNEKSFYLAQLFINNQEENKKLTKKSLMTKLAATFELAKPIKEFLLSGNSPDGIEQLSDEE